MAPAKRQPMTARPRRVGGAQASTSVYAPGTAVGERLAYAYGDLATGTTMYACHDQLGSVRRWRTPSKGNWGANEFEPYGEAYAVSTLAPRDYALHEWDPALAVYRAPYRNYSPTMTRWTTRDPLGMIDGPNMYGYVGGRAMNALDPAGLSCGNCDLELAECLKSNENELAEAEARASSNLAECALAVGVGCAAACGAWLPLGLPALGCATGCLALGLLACNRAQAAEIEWAQRTKSLNDANCYRNRKNCQCEDPCQ